ncbi:MAG: hypothetical protein IPJ86_08135, partial [Bacteroidetes bacterium]|nr:hypothetical protein [Bacteroidota bacterium]
KIFSAIIDSREKFLKYLTFLLTGEETDLIGNAKGNKDKSSANSNDAWAFTGTPVYEKLLIASSRFPDKVKSIDTFNSTPGEETTQLDEPYYSAEFELVNVIRTLLKQNA